MHFLDLFKKLTHIRDNMDVSLLFKALRQDALVWKGYQQLADKTDLAELFNEENLTLDDGTLGLYSLGIIPSEFRKSKLPVETLERIMLGFENYLQSAEPVPTLESATELALALIEKRKTAENWKSIILELVTRMKITSGEQFYLFWGSILAITANLAEDRDDLLKDLSSVQPPDLVLSTLIHSVLCLPLTDAEKADLFKRFLYPLSAQVQNNALALIKLQTGSEMARIVAGRILEKYSTQDFSRKNPSDYWKNPAAATQFAFQCQAAGDIAQIANDTQTALVFNQKSIEILSALVLMSKVKQAAINGGDGEPLEKLTFTPEELGDPEISSQLVYVDDEIQVSNEDSKFPVKALLQSRKMIDAGHPELAKEVIIEGFKKLDDELLEEVLVKGPDQIHSWDPNHSLDTLNSIGAYEETARLTSVLLKQNPTSYKANLAAAIAFDGQGDYASSLKYWEALALLDPQSGEIKRKLVRALVETGNTQEAFDLLNEIVAAVEEPVYADLVTLGEIALRLQKPHEALEAAGKLLAKDADDLPGLTITGIAYRMMNMPQLAVDSLQKAILGSGDDPRPWTELADIQWTSDEQGQALKTLRAGLAANPNQPEIQTIYAHRLMEQGSVAEAYPLLKELSTRGSDIDTDLLLIKAMKHLGVVTEEDTLEALNSRYPQDPRFQGEYGQSLVQIGKKSKGLEVLKGVKQEFSDNPGWTVAYADALLGTDYEHLAGIVDIDPTELGSLPGLLQKIVAQEPVNYQANLLLGEGYLQLGNAAAAFDVFQKLLDEQEISSSLEPERVLTGLSQAAARLGKPDIARAMLDQAIEKQPSWLGLKRIQAENFHLAGDDEAAVQLLEELKDAISARIENIQWAVDFYKTLEQPQQAEELIAASVEKFPQNIGLRLARVELKLDAGIAEFDPQEEAALKQLLLDSENPDELIRAAVVFASLDNQADTIHWLEKACELGSIEARFNLAGLYRVIGDHERALHVLESVREDAWIVELMRNEISFDLNQVIPDGGVPALRQAGSATVKIHETFLPVSWKEIFASSQPAVSQRIRFGMQTGDHTGLLERVLEWVDREPNNPEARVYAAEVALAVGSLTDYAKALDLTSVDVASPFTSQFRLLILEQEQDDGVFAGLADNEPIMNETINVEEPDQIAKIRALVHAGSFTDAETLFQMAENVYIDRAAVPYICQLGQRRNLVKAAVAVNRWNEVYEQVDQLTGFASANETAGLLRLKALISGIEHHNSIENLDVIHHDLDAAHLDNFVKINIMDYAVFSQHQQEEIKRWLLRGNLAMTPTKDNIRALAMLTPQPEDAAVMMTGLRKVGQVTTALQVAKKFCENTRVMFEAALCEAVNDTQAAIVILKKSLGADPNQPLVYRLLSKVFEEHGDLSKAVETLEKALVCWPDEAKWHLKAAELWTALGNLEKPVEHLQLAQMVSRGEVDVNYQLGEALLAAKRPVDALKYLVHAAENEPERHEVWEMLSEAHLQNGDLDLSTQAADRAVATDPSAVKAHLQAGKVSWTRGELEKALDQVRLAIQLDPEDADNYVFMARLQKARGDDNSALATLEKTSDSKNASVQTMIEHAGMVREINGVVAARDLLESFVKRYPENPELLRQYAEAEEICGDITKAEEVAKHALEMHPEEPELHMLLGKIQERMGNLDQAAHYYSQVIARKPRDIDAYLSLSGVFTSQREYTKARKVLEQGIDEGSPDIRLYLTCANLLKESKDYQGAESMLRKASALDPRNLNIHRQLGAVLALNMVHQSQEVSSPS